MSHPMAGKTIIIKQTKDPFEVIEKMEFIAFSQVKVDQLGRFYMTPEGLGLFGKDFSGVAFKAPFALLSTSDVTLAMPTEMIGDYFLVGEDGSLTFIVVDYKDYLVASAQRVQKRRDEEQARRRAYWRSFLNIEAYLPWIGVKPGVASNRAMKAIDLTNTEDPVANEWSDSPIASGGLNFRPYDESELHHRRRQLMQRAQIS